MKALLKLALSASAVIATSANATVTTYTDQASFAAAAGSLTTETFDSCGGSTVTFSGSLSSSAGPCGAIVPGITFSPTGGELYIAGPGQSTNPTTALGVNFPGSSANSITFDVGISAFGADLFQNLGGGSQGNTDIAFIIALFGAGDVALGVFNPLVSPNGGDFFGLTSTDSIFRIDVSQPGGFAVMDNVAFSSTAAVPEPGTWMMMLIGFGATGYAMRMRRRRKQAPHATQLA